MLVRVNINKSLTIAALMANWCRRWVCRQHRERHRQKYKNILSQSKCNQNQWMRRLWKRQWNDTKSKATNRWINICPFAHPRSLACVFFFLCLLVGVCDWHFRYLPKQKQRQPQFRIRIDNRLQWEYRLFLVQSNRFNVAWYLPWSFSFLFFFRFVAFCLFTSQMRMRNEIKDIQFAN